MAVAAVAGRVAARELAGRVLEPLQLGDDVLDHAKLLHQLLLGAEPLLLQVRVVERLEVLLDLRDDAVKVDEPVRGMAAKKQKREA